MNLTSVIDKNTPSTRSEFVRESAKLYKEALDEERWDDAREIGVRLHRIGVDDVNAAIAARQARMAS